MIGSEGLSDFPFAGFVVLGTDGAGFGLGRLLVNSEFRFFGEFGQGTAAEELGIVLCLVSHCVPR